MGKVEDLDKKYRSNIKISRAAGDRYTAIKNDDLEQLLAVVRAAQMTVEQHDCPLHYLEDTLDALESDK